MIKYLDNFSVGLFYWLINRGEKTKAELIRSLTVLKNALSQETEETKIMFSIYLKYTKGEASKDEMKLANEQFQDILKTLGLGVFAVLPFAPITIPFIVKLAHKFGIEILPSSFMDSEESKKNK